MKLAQILPLTSLRGIAAISVMLLHISTMLLPKMGVFLQDYTFLLEKSYLWVDFFFLLSGFILFRVYSQELLTHKLSYKSFLLVRLLRIYPLHFCTLLFFIIFELYRLVNGEGAFSGFRTGIDLLRNLFLVHSIQFNPIETTWNYPSWSLSTEWLAYLVFPFMVTFSATLSEKLKIIALLLCGLLVFWVSGRTIYLLDVTGYLGIIRCLAEIFAGLLLASNISSIMSFVRKIQSMAVMAIALLLICALHFSWLDGVVVLLMATVMMVCSEGEHVLYRILCHPIFVYLGKISFSIYLVHYPVLFMLKIILPKLMNGVEIQDLDSGFYWVTLSCLTIFITLSVSHFSYQWIEVAGRNWLQRIVTNKPLVSA